MTWLAVLAACALTGCVAVALTVLRRRRGSEQKALEPPADGVDTRPYDVRASSLQALEALGQRDEATSSARASVHETTTAKYAVALVPNEGLTPADEQAVSLMAEDGLTVSVHASSREDDLASGEVRLDTGPRVRQATTAHVVPPSLKSKG
jgi:hypothetical protein